jgi:hypothetical protein
MKADTSPRTSGTSPLLVSLTVLFVVGILLAMIAL